MNLQELEQLMQETGQPTYRAIQIFEWLHQRFPGAADGAFSFAAMSNLPNALRNELEKRCYITSVKIEKKLTAKDGTIKFLLALAMGGNESQKSQPNAKDAPPVIARSTATKQSKSLVCPGLLRRCAPRDDGAVEFRYNSNDGNPAVQVESVLMEYDHGRSLCISTQAGCRMGCYFCATGQDGLIRNLTAGEMCMQVYAAGKVRNIVLMGCGEPLDNFDSTMRFIELITHPKGAGIGQRHITLSTCGLITEMRTLAQRKLQINLAVSLHGPDDATRQALMPIARRYSVNELIAVCREYIGITHRRITFEYALAEGINDSSIQARALAKLLKGMLCHVNLIPVNHVTPSFSPTKRCEALAFAAILQEAKIPVTVRRTIGAEVNAACGQLRSRG